MKADIMSKEQIEDLAQTFLKVKNGDVNEAKTLISNSGLIPEIQEKIFFVLDGEKWAWV